ncbi:helix-turn-helix domain-containing protein [Methylocystis heyeri]|uniref:Helix-turn-helix domain-containing protein n=1 Tax=Methylocystis heyeri TaxID=391905 RepID=A0A6B8KJP5_9HYPH|nr:helix-turn-helix domain-containing protein [Methylocystis heyeri]
MGFLIFADYQILDLCGPFEAFYFAGQWLERLGKTTEPAYCPLIISGGSEPVRSMSGLAILPSQSFNDISDGIDTLIVAGGTGMEEASRDRELVDWVRSIAPRARRVASICSGAFILASAGLLHRRRATTHWMYSDLLAATYPSIEVDATKVFIRDGNIYTSGGITAGIDLALALVEEDMGTDVMLAVARTMVVFPRRPGGQSQFKTYNYSTDGIGRAEFRQLHIWIMAHPEADLSVPALAERMGMSPRNFSRVFREEMGQTPAQFAEKARADAARCKLEQTLLPVETIALECGFGDPERMRRSFQRLYEISPADYRARFRSTAIQ